MSCGTSGPNTSAVAFLDAVAGVDAQVLAGRHLMLALLADRACRASSTGWMKMVRLPRFFSPRRTTPATSAIMAGSRGVRASKISVTRGRPPVMSCVPATSRGVLASSVPADTFWPSRTSRNAFSGM